MAYDPQSAVAVGQHPAAVPPMGLPLPCWRSSEVGACPCDAPSSARRGGRGRVPGVPEELELIESPIIGGEEENRDGGLVSTAAAEAESSGQRVATPKRCTGRPRACTQPRKCAGSWRQEIRNLSTVGGEHQDQALPAASRQLRSTMNPQFAPPSARRVGELPRRVRSCYFRTGVTDVLAMFHPPPGQRHRPTLSILGCVEGQRTALQVHVGPAQGEQFTTPSPSGQGQHDD